MDKDGYIDINRYRAEPGKVVKLSDFSTTCDVAADKEKVKTVYFPQIMEDLSLLQAKLYAQSTYGLIIVLQAMDAAGKDGTIRHVFSHLDPNGVHVVSFKQPTTEEKDHDYMWRINRALPRRGDIGIFNRSHYEDVIVGQVHRRIDPDLARAIGDRDIWAERYEQIRNWEKYLRQNGFPMVKIFLHLSKDEQRERLVDRIIRQEKNWKFSLSDIEERKYWDKYQEVYEEVLAETSTRHAPWYVVPADNKWYTRYVVALITLKALRDIGPDFPELTPEVAEKLGQFKRLIQNVDIKELASLQSALKEK